MPLSPLKSSCFLASTDTDQQAVAGGGGPSSTVSTLVEANPQPKRRKELPRQGSAWFIDNPAPAVSSNPAVPSNHRKRTTYVQDPKSAPGCAGIKWDEVAEDDEEAEDEEDSEDAKGKTSDGPVLISLGFVT
jgi:hypothetical protein